MFSVIFPGQGSQMVGMGKEFFDKYEIVKKLFKDADDALNFKISKVILNGPKENLDATVNTQPAIFLISYSIFKVIREEFNINLNEAKYFAGHSLGEYSALSCAGYLDFDKTIKILRVRGNAMQNAVPKGEGGMLAVLGSKIENIEKILNDNEKSFKAQIANDNSDGQIVLSGKNKDLELISSYLKDNKIKNIKLPVSAPFHCDLMTKATEIMREELKKIDFKNSNNKLISNVTADEISDVNDLKSLLISQIEKKVRWRESIINMINYGVNQFIEIGPGKVLTGLIKRIDKNVKTSSINNRSDIERLEL
ncbi:ACP S-malonyltransferase [Candidatus Pelagibacter sp.]|nr:ACP S-malonyltransferase [Candidatus Pelagibacter sp.]